jgi:hypothetical protein
VPPVPADVPALPPAFVVDPPLAGVPPAPPFPPELPPLPLGLGVLSLEHAARASTQETTSDDLIPEGRRFESKVPED